MVRVHIHELKAKLSHFLKLVQNGETIIGLYKTEVIKRLGPWRNVDAVELETMRWVHWYNHQRLLQPLGWVPPAEYEREFEKRQAEQLCAV